MRDPDEDKIEYFWTNLGLNIIVGLLFALVLAFIMTACSTVQAQSSGPTGVIEAPHTYVRDTYGWDNRFSAYQLEKHA